MCKFDAYNYMKTYTVNTIKKDQGDHKHKFSVTKVNGNMRIIIRHPDTRGNITVCKRKGVNVYFNLYMYTSNTHCSTCMLIV